jgi:single-stranded DNA-specific DHH superfamily exonuclease
MDDLNTTGLALFKEDLKKAAKLLTGRSFTWARLVFHDDADGVTAAAITYAALKKLGIEPDLLCLEKAFPEALSLIHGGSEGLVVYVDMGSAHAELIAQLNGSRNLTLILDHHKPQPSSTSDVVNLNPELHGVDGGTYASGASVCYAFAKELKAAEPFMSALAVVGSSEIPGDPKGLNEEALKDALKAGLAEALPHGGALKVAVEVAGERAPRERWSTKLTTLSSVGYYVGGPRMAVDLCLGRASGNVEGTLTKLEDERKAVSQVLLSRIRAEGLNKEGSIHWLHAGDAFKNMGTKVIGTFLSYLAFQRRFIDRSKYLVGFMNVQPEIPGLGTLRGSYVKVSARAPDVLASLVKEGVKPPLSDLLPEAARMVGGFGDGHSVAASGIIPKGQERAFIKYMDSLASGKRPSRSSSLLDFMR